MAEVLYFIPKLRNKKEIEKIEEKLGSDIKSLANIQLLYNQISMLDDFSARNISRFELSIVLILKDIIKYCNDENGIQYLQTFKWNYIQILVELENNNIFPKNQNFLRERAIVELRKLNHKKPIQ
jgi:hypothetical protein